MSLSDAYEIVGMVGVLFTIGGAMWSRRAAKLSKPTGNGFASTVLTSLVRIDSRLDSMEARLDNLDPR